MAATGAGAGSGLWLFSYNKDNFGFDAGMRFGRFTMARGFANAQVGQYREDIEGIVGTTVSKMGAWQTVTTLFLAVGAALSCAGRVGMHGCAPPGWFCALFSGSIFMSVMFNGFSLWLSMHAALRAQCASVSLLTRKVRLPIPSMGQLDQARVFGSSFENQKARDVFRVPFMRHAQHAPEMPYHVEDGDKKSKKKNQPNDPRKEFASTSRDTVPSWIRDEVVVDKGDGFKGDGTLSVRDPLDAPEHFKMLLKAQEEWRDFDIYARVSMLYGVVSFLYAVTYYAVGTTISELRGFWVMWSVTLVFSAAQALIMRLDILRTGQHRLPYAEWLGHAAPFFAVIGCSLEYRYHYSEASVALSFGFALLAIFAHFVMALRMLDLAYPDNPQKDMPEEPGRQWWPGTWQVPSAFTRHLWFITPPTRLDPKVAPCLINEMKDMEEHGGGFDTKKLRKNQLTAPQSPALASMEDMSPYKCSKDLPWQLMRIVILTAALQWAFVFITTGVEVILGPESLLKPPGEPPWIRDTKYRTMTPSFVHLSTAEGLPDSYRLFSASKAYYDDDEEESTTEETATETAEETTSTAAHHRRLNGPTGALRELLRLAPQLGSLADVATASAVVASPRALDSASAPSQFMMAGPKVQPVAWPALFEPKHLVCNSKGEGFALSSRGVGARIGLASAGETLSASPFYLQGTNEFGRIAGASILDDQSTLRVITSSGTMLRCPGLAQCAPEASAKLPLPSGATIVTAAYKEGDNSHAPLVALVLKDAPSVVALYSLREKAWHPAGEVHLPAEGELVGAGSLSFLAQSLLFTKPSGQVIRRTLPAHLVGAASASSASMPSAFVGGPHREFQAACGTAEGEVVRLALRKAGALTWEPELVFSA